MIVQLLRLIEAFQLLVELMAPENVAYNRFKRIYSRFDRSESGTLANLPTLTQAECTIKLLQSYPIGCLHFMQTKTLQPVNHEMT